MRARNIKPGFFENDILAELPFEFRLLFIGLWMMADKSGRLEDRPKKIKMCVFPADKVDVDAGLSALASSGFIKRYEVVGVGYIQILNWEKHQRPHHTERDSVIPPFDNGYLTVNSPLQDVRNPPDLLIPDSLILLSPPTPLVGGVHSDSQKTKKHKKSVDYPDDFERAWREYPRKDGKRNALQAWEKAKARGMPVDLLPDHIESRRYENDWLKDGGRFVPHMATWLNRDGWLDDGAKIPDVSKENPVVVDFYENDRGIVIPKPGEVRQ